LTPNGRLGRCNGVTLPGVAIQPNIHPPADGINYMPRRKRSSEVIPIRPFLVFKMHAQLNPPHAHILILSLAHPGSCPHPGAAIHEALPVGFIYSPKFNQNPVISITSFTLRTVIPHHASSSNNKNSTNLPIHQPSNPLPRSQEPTSKVLYRIQLRTKRPHRNQMQRYSRHPLTPRSIHLQGRHSPAISTPHKTPLRKPRPRGRYITRMG